MAAGHAPRMPDAVDPRAPATRAVGPGSMTCARRRQGASLPSAPAYAGAEGSDTGCVHDGHQRILPDSPETLFSPGRGHGLIR